MCNVVKLTSRATSYYTIRKDRGMWAVQLVTPAPGKSLRTAIAWHPERDAAISHGKEVAARVLRPFKFGRAAQ